MTCGGVTEPSRPLEAVVRDQRGGSAGARPASWMRMGERGSLVAAHYAFLPGINGRLSAIGEV
jgi:hypothetical protein